MRELIYFTFFLIFFTSITVNARKSKGDSDIFYRERQKECQDNNYPPKGCKGIHIDFSQNCVYKCISDQCYSDFYLMQPVLPGEVDSKREKDFKLCVKTQFLACKNKLKYDPTYICIY